MHAYSGGQNHDAGKDCSGRDVAVGDVLEWETAIQGPERSLGEKARVTQLILAIYFFMISHIKQQNDHLLVYYLINKPERPGKLIIICGILFAALENPKRSRVL
jgi:hypothetical protein